MIGVIFTTAFVTQFIRIAVPYAFAALGGSITERSGVIDLALEAAGHDVGWVYSALAEAAIMDSRS